MSLYNICPNNTKLYLYILKKLNKSSFKENNGKSWDRFISNIEHDIHGKHLWHTQSHGNIHIKLKKILQA